MKKTNIGFPYPVLCDDNNDYIDSYFKLNAKEDAFVENGKLKIRLFYELKSPGLQALIDKKEAKVLLYAESSESSYRNVSEFDGCEIDVLIDSGLLSNTLKVKAMIISQSEIKDYIFDEHNKDLFGTFGFVIHKGDILALSNMFVMPLGLIDPLANKPSIFSIRPDDNAVDSIRVDLLEDQDRINIWLKRDLHNLYQELREESYFRTLLASYFVIPALVEALNCMKNIKNKSGKEDDEGIETHGWYQALETRLNNLNINLSTAMSTTTVANAVLGDMLQESMDSLRKIRDEYIRDDNRG